MRVLVFVVCQRTGSAYVCVVVCVDVCVGVRACLRECLREFLCVRVCVGCVCELHVCAACACVCACIAECVLRQVCGCHRSGVCVPCVLAPPRARKTLTAAASANAASPRVLWCSLLVQQWCGCFPLVGLS